jgi:Tfp pilus assembly protein PilX
MRYSKRMLSSQRGFILLTAIMATLILFALTLLILNLATSDLRVSVQSVGQKKAMSAAETGIHRLMQDFDPVTAPAVFPLTNIQVNPANDPASVYSISAPEAPTSGPLFIPMTGYSIGGGQSWGRRRFDLVVTGRNTTQDTKVELGVGVGYGPVEISTMMR